MAEETRDFLQLPPTAVAQGTDLLAIQAPDGPVQAIELARLIGRLGPVDVVAATFADLNLVHDAGALAIVWADPDPGKIGYWIKTGASGAGAWVYSEIFRGFTLNPSAWIVATEAIAAKDFVNLYDAAGALRVRKADASNPAKAAHGYVSAAVAIGNQGRVEFSGINTAAVLATAAQVWLSDAVPGAFTDVPPATPGHILQPLGPALLGVGIPFTLQPSIEL
jgi:hypothetical protein